MPDKLPLRAQTQTTEEMDILLISFIPNKSTYSNNKIFIQLLRNGMDIEMQSLKCHLLAFNYVSIEMHRFIRTDGD